MLTQNSHIKLFKNSWKSHKFNRIVQSAMGLRVLESCRLTPKQIEAIRRVFVKLTKREGKFFIRLQVNKSNTKKSKGSRMGKGAGSFNS
jgi:large subunit ribosomal protein L16